jgi:hypothetical protein
VAEIQELQWRRRTLQGNSDKRERRNRPEVNNIALACCSEALTVDQLFVSRFGRRETLVGRIVQAVTESDEIRLKSVTETARKTRFRHTDYEHESLLGQSPEA